MKIGEHQLWTVDPLQLKIIWCLWEQGMQGMWASASSSVFAGHESAWTTEVKNISDNFAHAFTPEANHIFLLSTVASALLAHAGPTIVNTNSSLHQILPGHLLLQLADSSFQKKWRCPKLGVALYNPFGSRIFHYKLYLNHPAMGVPPWLWKPPSSVPAFDVLALQKGCG